MSEESKKKLVEQVASRCYVTSDDKLIQDRLLSVVNNAIFSVASLIGLEEDNTFDFSLPSKSNELFLNYCMYRWNNKSQKEFEQNYMGDIISIRTKNEVEYRKKQLEETTNE